ncbi:MAG: histone deacetylase family protein, partial [Hyphomicrobiales bacterium]|nr:histone deacetylase family protein [Hyphomicrobiales bacterium]
GYCFLNNAAIAAEHLRANGAERVAILDVDYHHGNGTQAIFEARADVFFASLHADPRDEYPYFSGHADETGIGDGEGFTANYPLPLGTGIEAWMAALDHALDRIAAFSPDSLIVSLGLDTFENDPISKFRLKTADYPAIGDRLARIDRPCLFVMEGGYAVEDLGTNTVGVLAGYRSAERAR